MSVERFKKRWRSYRYELTKVLAPTILISSIFFLFGPFTIYSGNLSEFQVSLIDILKYYAVPGVVLIGLFLIVGMVVPMRCLHIYVSFLFMVGILLWIQGSFLVWEYGLLDGQTVDWGKKGWRVWIEGTFWVFLLFVAFIFSRAVSKISTLASIAIFFVLVMHLGFISYRNPEIWITNIRRPVTPMPPKEIYEFSSRQNVIQLVLDSFQSDIFQEIVDEDPDYYKDALNGFTFFNEAIGSFPSTYMSIPAILSGQNYMNQIRMPEFLKQILSGKTITNILFDNGFRVDLVSDKRYMQGRFSNGYTIPVPYGSEKEQYNQAQSALIMDVVLFRHAPHFLKKQIYANQAWLFQRFFHKEDSLRFPPLSHQKFFEDFTRNLTIETKKPVYKFIHLNSTHVPMVMNQDCEYAGKVLEYSRSNHKRQCKCGLDHFIAFLAKLKSTGYYDNSLIILQADHGAAMRVKMKGHGELKDRDHIENIAGSALPLLAIKLPNAVGPLAVSSAQVMLTDLPATIAAALSIKENFPGRSVFEINPKIVRERRYYHYKWLHEHWQADFFPRLDEYVLKGSTFEKSSWRLARILNDPGQSSYKTTLIKFGTPESHRFLLGGWSSDESDSQSGLTFNWALGSAASILLSLSKTEKVRMVANVKTITFGKPQTVTIKIDKKIVGTWVISQNWQWEKHKITIEPNKDRPDISVIEFAFSQYRDPKGEELRPLAVLFESITLEELR